MSGERADAVPFASRSPNREMHRATRSRLLDCAVREFGTKGLEGASTRAIASSAGVVQSAIAYYFGGKRELHLAAADHVAARLETELAPSSAPVHAIDEGERQAAAASALRLLARLRETMASDDVADCTLFLLRELMDPGPAFDRVWAGSLAAFLARLSDLVGVATGTQAPAAKLVSLSLFSEALAIRGSRATLHRLCVTEAPCPSLLGRTMARVASNAEAILGTRAGRLARASA